MTFRHVLADDLDNLAKKVRRVILAEDMSATGQATAIAMMVTMKLQMLEQAAQSLREPHP